MVKSLLPSKESPQAQKLIRRYLDYEDLEVLAKEFGFKDGHSFQTTFFNQYQIRRIARRSTKRRWDNPSKLKANGFLILPDVHSPFYDADFINQCLDLAYSWKVEQGITAGDFLDMTTFSIFASKPEHTWKKERDDTRKLMLAMRDAVPKWLMLAGNHEYFLIKKLAEEFDMQDILALLGNIWGFTATDYYFCEANEWHITHPRNVSVIHGRVAGRLATKLGRDVASGHGHLWGWVKTEDGKHNGIDMGVCCESVMLDYASQRDTLRPTMCKGALFLIKVGNKTLPYPVSPDTDWKAMRRMYE